MKYFSIDEFTRSETAQKMKIDNTPSAEHRKNIIEFIETLLDPLRESWEQYCNTRNLGTPELIVSSGYRSRRLNSALKTSSATSAHCIGYAADLIPANKHLGTFKEFCKEYMKNKAFDQLISEEENAFGVPQWIHLGYKNRNGEQRRQMLSSQGGKYTPVSTTKI